MTRSKLSLVALGGLALAAASTLAIARGTAERTDCPGKLVCPVSGEIICADQCPLGGTATASANVPSCCLER